MATSAMRETMARQPADLRALLSDVEPVEHAAERLRGRRLVLAGTGTSWHAANHGAWLLREAGVEAWPLQALDVALYPDVVPEDAALVVLSHRNTKKFSSLAGRHAGERGRICLVVGGRGSPGVDVETVEPERSSAFTASHLGAMMRIAQLAQILGADLGDLGAVPDAVAAALSRPGLGVTPPERLLEFTGAGPNQWTAAEGALKVRETCYLATEGLSVEQLLHGPAVALDRRDALVALDGGGPGAERLEDVAGAAEAAGTAVYRLRVRELGEPLSVFPLTVLVQRIALESAEALGTNPDNFREDEHSAWRGVGL